MNLDYSLAEVSLRKDSDNLSSKPDLFVKDNILQTAILIFAWRQLAYEIDEEVDYVLTVSLREQGLHETIADCCRFADQCIIRKDLSGDIASWLNPVVNVLVAADSATSLQFLRFAKRFTFLNADKLEQISLNNFLQTNNRVKLLQRRELPQWLIYRLRQHVYKICRGFKVDPLDRRFSPGTCCDAGRPLVQKVRAVSRVVPNTEGVMYPLSSSFDQEHLFGADYAFEYRLGVAKPAEHYVSEVIAVPKNYKTARIIAREHAYRGYELQAVREALERCVSHSKYAMEIDIHDQETNRELGRYGVRMGNFATVDLSSASDSIRYDLVMSIFPADVLTAVRHWDSSGFSIDGRVHTKYMWGTSGAATTFIMESIVFHAIMTVSTDLYCEFSGVPRSQRDRYQGSVMGDDIIVHSEVFDTLCDILKLLGFVVNADKSFCEENYRETCGGEWFLDDGVIDSTTFYWPRKALCPCTAEYKAGKVAECYSTLSSLISLQHRLYPRMKLVDSARLGRVVNDYATALTGQSLYTVPCGTDSDDIWDIVSNAPQKCFVDGCEASRRMRVHHITTGTGFNDPHEPMVEMWLYQDFLKYGPRYESPLDALLGVSTSRRSAIAQIYKEVTPVLVTKWD